MKLSLNWLRELVDVDWPVEELARRLIDATAEVENWETLGAQWDSQRIRVASVVAVEPHPNADRLRLATVETGTGRQQVVCGAPNLAVGQKVAFATEGAELVDGHTGERSKLKLRPIRGVDSAGMVLSEKELGLSDDHEGILVLPDDAVVGRPLSEQLGDVIFDISTWANRADLLGVLGFAREVGALTGNPVREPNTGFVESGPAVTEFVSIAIEDPELCPRFTAAIIENVTIGPSPEWMQERLKKHGMRPINNVVDISNYVMIETGQPTHAFDYDLVRGKKLVARRAHQGEKLTTLDGIDRVLDSEMMLVCDGEGPVSVAGIIGGGNSEVRDNTATVLFEVANWKAGSIRRTSTQLKVRTEASSRFEKGLGPEMAMLAQKRALHLFQQLTGGRIARGIIDVYPGQQPQKTIILPASRIEQVLGITIAPDTVREILTNLGFLCHHLPPDRFSVQPPYWRPDVSLPDDVIEDLGRIYGYDKLPATLLRGRLPDVEPRPMEELRERLRDTFSGLGFQEIITYTMTDKTRLDRVVEPGDPVRGNPLGVVNPVAEQHRYLRTSMRAALLETFASNRRHQDGALRLFEIGFEYLPTEADLPHERTVLCAVVGGPRESRWARAATERLDFFDAKGSAEAALDALGIRATYQAAVQYAMLDGHTAEIRAGKEVAGIVAQVHPSTAAQFDIEEPVFIVELWPEVLVRALPERPEYSAPSRFPAVHQDLAFVVPGDLPAGRLMQIVNSHKSGNVAITASLFDEFRGGSLAEGSKSLAVHLSFQAQDRTLTDDDVARIRTGLVRRLEKELGATLRS